MTLWAAETRADDRGPQIVAADEPRDAPQIAERTLVKVQEGLEALIPPPLRTHANGDVADLFGLHGGADPVDTASSGCIFTIAY